MCIHVYTCVYMCILLLPASLFPTVYLTYLFMPCQFLKAKIFKESLAGPSFRAEHDLLGDVSIDLNQERSCVDLSTSHLSTKPALFILLDVSRSFLVGMQFDSFILYIYIFSICLMRFVLSPSFNRFCILSGQCCLRGSQLVDLSGTDFHRILKEVSGQSANAQWPGGGEHHSLTFLETHVIQMSLQLITRERKKNIGTRHTGLLHLLCNGMVHAVLG